jgi:7-cyano-7-deazaguanine synthase
MDSVCIAFWKRPDLAITIDYGQRPAAGEIRAASAVCAELDIRHVVLKADISKLGSGDLAGLNPAPDAPASEWWPYRNQFLLTLAAMQCHRDSASTLMIGALRTDGFHADGTQRFVDLMNGLFEYQEGGLRVEAPAIDADAAELVELSCVPLSILAWSHSCHIAEHACGFCRGCRKHYETMAVVNDRPY